MLVVNRYRVAAQDAEEFLALARPALAALADRPGFVDGQVGRSTDDPGAWVMATRWESVGAYRRALSAYEVKVHAVPLMYRAVDEPGAYEVLLETDGGPVVENASDLAPRGPDSLGGPSDLLE